MLVILPVFPVSAPLKPVLCKQFEAQVFMVNLVWEVSFPVQVRFSGFRLYDSFPVHDLRIWIVQRVDIHSQAQAVFGYAGGMGNKAEIERRRIVILHG